MIIREDIRMLQCRKCESIIEPFDFLWQWACKDRNLEYTRQQLKKEIEKLGANLKELKRQEHNIKARIKAKLEKQNVK